MECGLLEKLKCVFKDGDTIVEEGEFPDALSVMSPICLGLAGEGCAGCREGCLYLHLAQG